MGNIILCTIIHTVCYMYLFNGHVGYVNIRGCMSVNIFSTFKCSYRRAYLVCSCMGCVLGRVVCVCYLDWRVGVCIMLVGISGGSLIRTSALGADSKA